MTEIFEFAKNAVDLPNDPTLYTQNTAYKSKPDNQLINNGFGTQIYVDTAPLNYYLNKLTSFIKTFKNYGVISEQAYNDIFTPDNPREGDVYLKGHDFRLYYFKDGKERLLEECATSEQTGLIIEPFTHPKPIELIPFASLRTAGYIFRDKYIIKKNFNYVVYSSLKRNKKEQETESNFACMYFFAPKGRKISIFPQSPYYNYFEAVFYFQKLYVNNVEILIEGRSRTRVSFHIPDDCEDFYTLEHGTICY